MATDLAKFVSLLHTRALYIPNVLSLAAGDPHEGAALKIPHRAFDETISAVFVQKEPDVGAAMAAGFRAGLSKETLARRARTYVSCWHVSDHESFAMWRVYGGALAIRSTPTALARSGVPDSVHRGLVRYVDYDRHTGGTEHGASPEEHAFAASRALFTVDRFFMKRQAFEYEKEYRLVIMDEPTASAAPGKTIPVELDTLVENVYVAPDAPGWFKDIVVSLCAKYAPGLVGRVRQSSMALDPTF